jgi:hypothetical protein
MKSWIIVPLLIMPLLAVSASCGRSPLSTIPLPQPQNIRSASPSAASVDAPVKVGELSLSQLSSRGCGMALWRKEQRGGDRFLLFNGLQPTLMAMMIDGKIVQFERIQSSGQAFYGQTTAQIFRSQDGAITAQVNVSLGELGEIESIAVKSGFIRLIKGNQAVTIPVVGDAGC